MTANIPKIETLAEVIESLQQFPWSYALFVDSHSPWNGSTKCAVLDPDDIEDPDGDEPAFALQHGLQYGLLITDLQSIVDNALQQKPNSVVSDFVRAINYYHAHDAFIDLSSE